MLGTATAPAASGGIGGGFLQGQWLQTPVHGLLARETSKSSGGATVWLWTGDTAKGSNDLQLCCDWTEYPSLPGGSPPRTWKEPRPGEGTLTFRRGGGSSRGDPRMGCPSTWDGQWAQHLVAQGVLTEVAEHPADRRENQP